MTRFALSLATALAILGGSVRSALANDWTSIPVARNEVDTATTHVPLVSNGDCGHSCTIDCGCCDCRNSRGLIGMAEALFMTYGRADGVRVGIAPGEDEDFDYEVTPRFTVGWMGASGLGARVRYWEFNHDSTAGAPENLSVDTYTVDFEIFQAIALSRIWNLEVAGGVRYNEFQETMFDDGDLRSNGFHGLGGLASAELSRRVGHRGRLFTRVRAAMLVDDKHIFNNEFPVQDVVLNDVTVGMLELAIGCDYTIPLNRGAFAFIRTQAEWQHWYNYSSSFQDANERFVGQSDVSFYGFGVALGIMR